MTTRERTTAEVFPRYTGGAVLADSAALKWPGFFAWRYRFPRVVDGFLVPATAEPLIVCISSTAGFVGYEYCSAYAERDAQLRPWWEAQNRKQPGGPAKLAQALITIASQQERPLSQSRG